MEAQASSEYPEVIVGEGDAIYVCAGGKDGYVGRDGRLADGEQRVSGPPGAA